MKEIEGVGVLDPEKGIEYKPVHAQSHTRARAHAHARVLTHALTHARARAGAQARRQDTPDPPSIASERARPEGGRPVGGEGGDEAGKTPGTPPSPAAPQRRETALARARKAVRKFL